MPKKRGPESRLTEWEKPEKLLLIVGWKRNGLTDVEIAKNIGIGVRTLYDWRNKSPHIKQALKRGKEAANFQVENALYKKAIEGNVTAMIFYLKNNWRNKYNDSPKTEEENQLVIEQKRKLKAEADIAVYKAKTMATEGDEVQINIMYPQGSDEEHGND